MEHTHANELENNLIFFDFFFFLMFWFRIYLRWLFYGSSFRSLFPEEATTAAVVVQRVPFHHTDHSLSVLHKQSWNSAVLEIHRFEFSN